MPGYEGGAGKLIFVLGPSLSSPRRGIRIGGAVLEGAWALPGRPSSDKRSAILRGFAEKWPSG